MDTFTVLPGKLVTFTDLIAMYGLPLVKAANRCLTAHLASRWASESYTGKLVMMGDWLAAYTYPEDLTVDQAYRAEWKRLGW